MNPSLRPASSTSFSLEVRTANDLSENDKNQIWDLFASNMRHMCVTPS